MANARATRQVAVTRCSGELVHTPNAAVPSRTEISAHSAAGSPRIRGEEDAGLESQQQFPLFSFFLACFLSALPVFRSKSSKLETYVS